MPLFERSSAPQLDRLAAGATRRALARGETLLQQGELPSGFYAVVHGRLALTSAPGR